MASTAIMRNERLAYMKFCLEDDDQHISCSDMFTELPLPLRTEHSRDNRPSVRG